MTHDWLTALIYSIKSFTFGCTPDLHTSEWFYARHLDVYMRNVRTRYEGSILSTLVVANVWVPPEHRRQGIYSEFLKQVEDLALELNRSVIVENVWDAEQWALYERRGYVPIVREYQHIAAVKSFIKVLPNTATEPMPSERRRNVLNAIT